MDNVKCFVLTSDDPEEARVMFAKTSIEAKRWWANEHGCGIGDVSAKRKPEWDRYAGQGVPALERIADGWWYECEGCGTKICEDYIGTQERHSDGFAEYALTCEYGPDSTVPVMNPVEPKRGHVWCHQSCYEQDVAARSKRRRWEERIHAWLVRRLMAQMPDAKPLPLPDCEPGECSIYGSSPTHSYVYVSTRKYVYRPKPGWRDPQSHGIDAHQVSEASVHFAWPGAKYGHATFRIVDERSSRKPRRAQFYVAGGDRVAFEAWSAAQRGERSAA